MDCFYLRKEKRLDNPKQLDQIGSDYKELHTWMKYFCGFAKWRSYHITGRISPMTKVQHHSDAL